MSLVDLDGVKSALGIASTTSAETAYLNRQIALANEVVRGYLGRRVSRTTYQGTWNFPTGAWAADFPVESISSATADGVTLDTSSEIGVVKKTGQFYRLENGVRTSWAGVESLSITYIAGLATIPADIVEAIYIGIQTRWETFTDNNGMAPAQTVTGVTLPSGAGGVRYAAPTAADAMGGGTGIHWLAGFPLGILQRHVDVGRPFQANSTMEFSIP